MGAPSLGNTDTVNELVGTHIASLKADDADRHCRVFVCNPRFGHTDTVNERRNLIPCPEFGSGQILDSQQMILFKLHTNPRRTVLHEGA